MAVTTFQAFRAEMIAAVQALVPTTPLHDRAQAFALANDESPFRAWATANPDRCTRVFTIYDLFDDDPVDTSDSVSDIQPVRCEVLVAYQHDFKYGAAKIRARQDVIRQDFVSIEHALGIHGQANFTNGGTVKEDGPPFDVEHGAGVSILRIPYLVRYFHAV